MTEREKEWKELFFFLDSLDTSVILNRKRLAWKLLQAGYTKSHFPIEELKMYIQGLYLNNNNPSQISTIRDILNRIRYLERKEG